MDSILRKKGCGLLCKLDIGKAYDHISWEFVYTLLERMGFGLKWLEWVNWCMSFAFFSVLFHGTHSGFFRSSRGMRRQDPLSLYLFIIGMEVLSCLIQRAVGGNFFIRL